METFQYTHFTFVKESSEQTPLKQRLRKYNSNLKKTLDGQRLPTQLERKIAIRNKTHRKSSLLKQNNKEEKEILPLS